MGLAIDGLVSGMDTTGLINSLMKIEALPQNLLKQKVSSSQSFITALQGLNSKISSLADLATPTAKPDSFDVFTASSSSSTVTASASKTAAAGHVEFTVDRLAQAQVAVSDLVTEWSATELTITGADGVPLVVTADSTSLDDIVSAINKSDAGVTAVKVAAGKDAITGEAQYRLQFTAKETGLAGGFTITGGTEQITTIKQPEDAAVKLWAGTSVEQTITSSTNTFANLLPGVDVTVTTKSDDPVTLTVARDDKKIGKMAGDLVDKLNGIFAEISVKSTVTNSTDANGKPMVSGGPFTGDSTVRDANQKLLAAASLPVGGKSPSEIGVTLTKTGTLEFDPEKFQAALKENPAQVQSMMQELATRVADAATSLSDKYDGSLTTKIKGQESVVKDLNTQVDEWDRRLTSRRSALERTYAALEVQLSKMHSQSNWLGSQLAGLQGGSSS